MTKNNWLIGGALLALVALLVVGRNQLKSVLINGADALKNANVQALLAMIKKFESDGKYNVLYGGGTFADYSKHPQVRVPFFNPATQKPDYSTAAGAYQINFPTWSTVLKYAGAGDFSPASQDAAAVWLLKLNGALAAIMDGDFDTAIRLASKTWASLPYTASKQNHVSQAAAQLAYVQAGGRLA